jgi:hypothetical protein
MQITREFLEIEIRDLEQEVQKANAFVLQAQSAINVYKMLIGKLDIPEPEKDNVNTDA